MALNFVPFMPDPFYDPFYFYAWPLPNPGHGLNPLEAEAVNETDDNYDEHQNARHDWGDDGKNHKTIN